MSLVAQNKLDSRFFIGLISGYIFGNYIGGEREGEPGRIHWEFFLNTFKIHLHHWIVMSVLLIIYLLCIQNNDTIIIGFLLGGITQGLTYSDRFKITQP